MQHTLYNNSFVRTGCKYGWNALFSCTFQFVSSSIGTKWLPELAGGSHTFISSFTHNQCAHTTLQNNCLNCYRVLQSIWWRHEIIDLSSCQNSKSFDVAKSSKMAAHRGKRNFSQSVVPHNCVVCCWAQQIWSFVFSFSDNCIRRWHICGFFTVYFQSSCGLMLNAVFDRTGSVLLFQCQGHFEHLNLPQKLWAADLRRILLATSIRVKLTTAELTRNVCWSCQSHRVDAVCGGFWTCWLTPKLAPDVCCACLIFYWETQRCNCWKRFLICSSRIGTSLKPLWSLVTDFESFRSSWCIPQIRTR